MAILHSSSFTNAGAQIDLTAYSPETGTIQAGYADNADFVVRATVGDVIIDGSISAPRFFVGLKAAGSAVGQGNVYAQISATLNDNTESTHAGPAVRHDGGAVPSNADCYYVDYRCNGSVGSAVLYKFVNSSGSVIGSPLNIPGWTPGDQNSPQTVRIEVQNSGSDVLVRALYNGTPLVFTQSNAQGWVTDPAASTPLNDLINQHAGAWLRDTGGTALPVIHSLEIGDLASFAIDTPPGSITAGTQASVVVSNPVTAPTTGNTQVKFTDDSGPAATVDSVTGSGPYTINFTFSTATAAQFDATGYPLYVEVDAENDTSAAIAYNEPAGQDYTDLSNSASPIVASPARVTGMDVKAYSGGVGVVTGDVLTNAGESYYCSGTGTLNTAPTHTGGTVQTIDGVKVYHLDNLSGSNIAEVWEADGNIYGRTTTITNSTTTAADGVDGWSLVRKAGSALDGYSGDKPVSGDQIVYENPTPENSITSTVEADGNWILNIPPPVTQTMDWYVIQADGTVGSTGTATFVVSTTDTTPDAFSFTAQTGVALATLTESNAITVTGITANAAISITGGEYSIDQGAGFGSYTSNPGTVANGHQVKVRQTSSSSFSTLTTATLTIGGVSGAFNITTLAADTTPTQFTFADQSNVAISTTIASNTITVTGINSPAAISISSAVAATYAINGGTPTSSPGTVNNGDSVIVYLPSSSSGNATTSATLTIGGVSDTFSVSTASLSAIGYSAVSFYIEDDASIAAIVGALTVIPLSGSITYSILSGNTNNDFSIGSSTGIISVANTLSNGRTPLYTLVVRATDTASNIVDTTVTINVSAAGSSPSVSVWTVQFSGLN